jgi:hypothetical protein
MVKVKHDKYIIASAFGVKGNFLHGLESAQLFAHLSPKWCVIWCPLWPRIDVSVLACCMQINGLLAASLGPNKSLLRRAAAMTMGERLLLLE